MQTMRYEPTFYTAWRQVRQGKIGKVRLINGQKSYKLGTRPPFFYDPLCFGGNDPMGGNSWDRSCHVDGRLLFLYPVYRKGLGA